MSWVVKASPVIQQLQEMFSNNEFNVGDRVRMTEIGTKRWRNQSRGSDGTVTARFEGYDTDPEKWVEVRWDSGGKYGYPTYPEELRSIEHV